MDLKKINLFEMNNTIKLRLSTIKWEDLINDQSILFKVICDLLLNKYNLIYYATQKESTKTVVETKKYVDNLIKNNNLTYVIDDIYASIGWNDKININNTTFQGDLAEYLMNILLDKFTNIETLISKISFKTNSNMSVYGNDNIYFDYDNDILYFGESKFYKNANEGFEAALNSINNHSGIEEFGFVRNHTSSYIAENGEKRLKIVEKFETVYTDDINIKSIVFVMNEDIYNASDYEKMLLNYFGDKSNLIDETKEIIIVFLPILSKIDFLNYFVGRINNEK